MEINKNEIKTILHFVKDNNPDKLLLRNLYLFISKKNGLSGSLYIEYLIKKGYIYINTSKFHKDGITFINNYYNISEKGMDYLNRIEINL
jgi:hypothetical protein